MLLLWLGRACPARAQVHPEEVSRTKLMAFNVALTGTFAVGRRWAEGQLTSWEEALETFLYGGAGGYGFYHAKRLVGNRRPLTGMGLAYLSSSVVENTAQGRGPFSHLRVGAGPVDVRWRTPLADPERAGSSYLTVEVNVLSALSFALLPLFKWQPSFQNGMLYYKKRTSAGSVLGRTFNRTVLLYEEAGLRSGVRAHEAIHVVQALQVGAVTPYYRLSAFRSGLDRSASDHWTGDVQIDWLYTLLAPTTLFVNYSDRWTEIEAHTLGRTERGTSRRREGVGPWH